MFNKLRSLLGPKASVQYIFILSAMRSGSTLLQHICGQQPHVLSAGETKIEYDQPDKLNELKQHLFAYNAVSEAQQKKTSWVFLEKCVHARYLPSLKPFPSKDMRFIFVLREPHAALTSLMERKNWPYTESLESGAWYYGERPKELVGLARELDRPENAYFLTYEDFLENTQQHLEGLTRFLRMPEPLQEEYRQQKWTAKLSLGDVSPNIKSRQVVANRRKELADIPESMAAGLKKAFEAARSELDRICLGQKGTG
ncbi:MAG: sulfotransferase family protein [Oceanipulchritudo sp.]